MAPIDDVDRKILEAIQREFPLCERPYRALGQTLGLTEEEVHRRVVALRKAGVVRRLGPFFNSSALGFSGHLAAAKVSEDAVERVAEALRDCSEVTHNYLRSGEFNVWFTVTAAAAADVEHVLDRVRACKGVASVRVFPSVRTFKLNTAFRISTE